MLISWIIEACYLSWKTLSDVIIVNVLLLTSIYSLNFINFVLRTGKVVFKKLLFYSLSKFVAQCL